MARLFLLAVLIAVPFSCFGQGNPALRNGIPHDPAAWYATKPHAGFSLYDLTEVKSSASQRTAILLKTLKATRGAMVLGVLEKSSAHDEGFEPLDLITHLDTKPIADAKSAVDLIRSHAPGDVVRCRVMRLAAVNPRPAWKTVNGTFKLSTYFLNCKNACEIAHDDISGVTVASYFSQPNDQVSTYLALQIVQHGRDELQLRWRVQYAADDWIFAKKITLVGPTERVELTVEDPLHEVLDRGGIRELMVVPIEETQSSQLLLSTSNKLTMRLSGPEFYKDIEIDADEVAKLKSVYDYFAMLTGKPVIQPE